MVFLERDVIREYSVHCQFHISPFHRGPQSTQHSFPTCPATWMGCASCILFQTQQDLRCGSIPPRPGSGFSTGLFCEPESLTVTQSAGCNMSNRPSSGTRILGMAEIALSIKHAERGQWNLTSGSAASSLTPLQYPYPVLPLSHLLKSCTSNLTIKK